jgi:hypothetical protein
VYAGPRDDFVVQIRLKSLELRADTARLTREIYGSLAPRVSFEGQIGEDIDGKEPLYIYVMSRVRGVSHLDFILAWGDLPRNSPENFAWRKNLIADVARYAWLWLNRVKCLFISRRFFALAWKNPQKVNQAYRDDLRHRHETELRLLLTSLPDRFHPKIKESLHSMAAIFSLPMVLLHKDFGICNIMVDSESAIWSE